MAEFITIEDPTDPRLADYRDLRDVSLRKHLESEHGLFLAEGEKVVRRALEAGFEPRSFLMAPRWLAGLGDLLDRCDAPCFVMSEQAAEEVTGFHVHRGALASLHRRPLPSVDELLAGARSVLVLEDVVDHTNVGCSKAGDSSSYTRKKGRRSRIAILDGLVDHTNVGACFRSAAAMGVGAVLVTPTCADPLYRRAIRVSMGTVFQVPWTRIDSWPNDAEQLKAAGYVVAGMTLGEGSTTLDELVAEDHQNLALVFGTEGHGLAAQTERALDRKVTIPMMGGVDSLNVAASSAVAFYATR